MTVNVGIDPGLTGAVCIMESAQKIRFRDTPTLEVKVGKSLKNQMDAHSCASILEELQHEHGQELFVTIEKVAPMPSFNRDGVEERRTMGVTSAFNFGMGFGMWIGICAALDIPYQLVHPRTWKASMLSDMGKEKDASRIKAMQLFPWTAKDLARKKDHGRADALLLAAYGSRYGDKEWEKPKRATSSALSDTLF
jgi:crossover junction endodeoxyribonuclease RuvC